MDSNNTDVGILGKTLEERRLDRIREYAYAWYEFRKIRNIRGTEKGDWAKGEHIVDSEDKINDNK